jgi:hypothetical protein
MGASARKPAQCLEAHHPHGREFLLRTFYIPYKMRSELPQLLKIAQSSLDRIEKRMQKEQEA